MKKTRDMEKFLGITEYLSHIHTEKSHDILRDAFIALSKTVHSGEGVSILVSYVDPEDVLYVYSVLSTRADDPYELKKLYRNLMDGMGAGGIYTKDLFSIALMAGLASNQKDWDRFKKNEEGLRASVCAVLAAYLSLVEKGRYLEAHTPDLVRAIEDSDPPDIVQEEAFSALAGIEDSGHQF